MRGPLIRTQASYATQNVRKLLTYHDRGLHVVCKRMPSMSVPRKFIRLPPKPYTTTHSWALLAWGNDIVGHFEKATARGTNIP